MIILKGQVPHTTHSYTKRTLTKRKKIVEKERQQEKAKYASIKQRKARKKYSVDTLVLINLQLVFINKN